MLGMDQSNRRKVQSSRQRSARKNCTELNGNNHQHSISNCKSENNHRSKQTRDCYKNEEQDHGRMNNPLPNYVPVHGQRLYAAVSDPAVCGYPVSLAYPYDPVAVSLGYPMYQPPPYHHHRVPYKDTLHSPRRPRLRNNCEKVDHTVKDAFETVDEYTSLPPGNLQDIELDHQRRFSDPGLANNSATEEDSLSSNGSSASWCEDSQIASQIETLVQENKRLSKELKGTQSELQELKLEVASLSQIQSSCEPGFISDLVREVHEATKLREDTLMARIRVFSEHFNQSQPMLSSVSPKKECTKECEEKKGELVKANLERDELSRRLEVLEKQMQAILDHNRVQDRLKEDLLKNQKENCKLKEELKSVANAMNAAEANVAKYERLLSSVTKKLPNGLVLEDKISIASETSESLSSSLGSRSLTSPQPQVTMSGPVTDL